MESFKERRNNTRPVNYKCTSVHDTRSRAHGESAVLLKEVVASPARVSGHAQEFTPGWRNVQWEGLLW